MKVTRHVRVTPTDTVEVTGEQAMVEQHLRFVEAHREHQPSDCSDYKASEKDLPYSYAGHNPYWCGGDMNGQCCGDDPCWSCIGFLLDAAIGRLQPA